MKENTLNLTYPQKSIWLSEQYYSNTTINNINGTLRINEKVDFKSLETALNLFIKNNDITRIKIILENNIPRQYINDYAPFTIQKIKINNLNDLNTLEENFYNKYFDFKTSKLYRFVMFEFPNGTGGFLACLHHIIADAWTMKLLVDNVMDYYSNLLNNTDINNSNTYSYLDYINSENEYKKSEKYQKDKEYWENIFDSSPEISSLNPLVKSTSNKANRKIFKFNLEESLYINKFCKENKISPFALFTAIFSIYLSKCSNVDNVIIGVPILNRGNYKEKHTAGMFITTQPFKIKINNNLPFSEFVKKIYNDELMLFRHKKYPYDNILNYVREKFNLNENLYTTIISYQNARTEIKKSIINYETNWKFNEYIDDELNFHIYDMDDTGELSLFYDYRIDVFNETDIENIHNRLKSILYKTIDNFGILIKNIDIVTDKEKNILLNDFNNTEVKYDKQKTISQLFEEQADKTPDRIALVFENSTLTYKELNEKSNSLAFYLRNCGIKNNDLVAIVLNRSFEMIISILAVLKSGGAYIPIDPEYPKERIDYMLEDSNCKVLLSSKKIINKLNKKAVLVDLDNSAIYNHNKYNIVNISKPDDYSYIIYTSGSTGKPKGVILKHMSLSNLTNYCNNYIEYLKDNKYRTIVSVTTVSFDIFIFETLISLQKGLKLVIANENEQNIARLLNELILNQQIEIIQTTPSRMKILLNNINDIPSLKNLKYITLAGEPLPISLSNTLHELSGAKIYNGYGPSETTVFSTLTDVTNYSQMTIGKPLDNTQIYILNKMNLCPIGIPGEIYISGDGVGYGYINKEQLTKNSFLESPFLPNKILYKTGDMGYYKKNGEIICLGRVDNQIKIRGLRIELEEIEKKLTAIEKIRDAVVIKKELENGHEFLCAFYLSNFEISSKFIREHLNKSLPNYMIPQYFIRLDKIPYTPNGKIDKKSLQNIKIELSERKIIPARNKIDSILLEILKDILKIDTISINDSFFDLGGDSLSAINLCIMIFNKFNVEISIKDILDNSIIMDLSDFISSKTNINLNNIIQKSENKPYYPLSSAQKRIYYSSKISSDNSILYNMPGCIILDKIPNINKLEKCFNTLIKNHDILRTYFETINEDVVQKITNKIDFKLKIEEINEKDTTIENIFKEFVKPFDLTKPPLFRCKLVILSDKTLLLFDMHHIISDGISIKLFIEQLCKLYNNETVTYNTLSYKDYAIWENNQVNQNSFKNVGEFWLNQFNDEIPILDIPTTYERPVVRKFNGAKEYEIIDEDTTQKIKQVCKENEVTPYMFLISIYYILLSKYSGQEDIIVGTPIVGRNRKELSNIIGMFVNTLPLRNKINSSDSFKDFLNKIKQKCLDSFDNQSYPFDELVDKLKIKRDTSRNPLFDTVFAYQNNGNVEINLKGINANYYDIDTHISKFDLSLEVIPKKETFKLTFEYCTNLFSEEFIKRFSLHYKNILKNVLDNLDKRILDIDMLSPKEKEKILNEFNNTKTPYLKEKNIVQLFEEQVTNNPNNIAIISKYEKLTYDELNQKANKLARYLLSLDAKQGDVIPVLLNRTPDLIITILAIIKLGCVYLPISSEFPTERIQYILENSNANILITTSSNIKIPDDLINNIYLDKIDYSKYESSNLNIPINIDEIMYIIYTSGSTGTPKGVKITHNNLNNFVNSFKNLYDNEVSNKDICLASTSIAFDVSMWEIFFTLLSGAKLHLYDEDSIKDILHYTGSLIKDKITLAYIPPNILEEVFSILSKKNNILLNKILIRCRTNQK